MPNTKKPIGDGSLSFDDIEFGSESTLGSNHLTSIVRGSPTPATNVVSKNPVEGAQWSSTSKGGASSPVKRSAVVKSEIHTGRIAFADIESGAVDDDDDDKNGNSQNFDSCLARSQNRCPRFMRCLRVVCGIWFLTKLKQLICPKKSIYSEMVASGESTAKENSSTSKCMKMFGLCYGCLIVSLVVAWSIFFALQAFQIMTNGDVSIKDRNNNNMSSLLWAFLSGGMLPWSFSRPKAPSRIVPAAKAGSTGSTTTTTTTIASLPPNDPLPYAMRNIDFKVHGKLFTIIDSEKGIVSTNFVRASEVENFTNAIEGTSTNGVSEAAETAQGQTSNIPQQKTEISSVLPVTRNGGDAYIEHLGAILGEDTKIVRQPFVHIRMGDYEWNLLTPHLHINEENRNEARAKNSPDGGGSCFGHEFGDIIFRRGMYRGEADTTDQVRLYY